MDWLLIGQSAKLDRWQSRPHSFGVEQGPQPADKRDNHEREAAQEPPGPPLPNGPFRRLADSIVNFDIFGNVAEAVLLRKPIEVGDVVGMKYRLMPGLRNFFAARVYERFDHSDSQCWRAGFSYRTLSGHPMCGEETFCVEKELATGRIVVALRSWSRPAHWTTRIGYPLARRWLLQAARAALDHLQRITNG